MLQASQFDGPSLDPFSLQQDGLTAPEVDAGRRKIVEALVIAAMIVPLAKAAIWASSKRWRRSCPAALQFNDRLHDQRLS